MALTEDESKSDQAQNKQKDSTTGGCLNPARAIKKW
jgi:hypothetical protein